MMHAQMLSIIILPIYLIRSKTKSFLQNYADALSSLLNLDGKIGIVSILITVGYMCAGVLFFWADSDLRNLKMILIESLTFKTLANMMTVGMQ